MAKGKSKKNPGRLYVTNAGGKKSGGGKKKSRGFLDRAFGALAKDGKDGAFVYLGRKAGELGTELGDRYLEGVAGDFAALGGQVGLWYAIKKFGKGSWGRMLRLGLLSEAINGFAEGQGFDPVSMVLDMLPEDKGKTSTSESGGTSSEGLGAHRNRREPVVNRIRQFDAALGY